MHNSAVCGLRAAPEPLLLQHQRTTAACPSGCSHRLLKTPWHTLAPTRRWRRSRLWTSCTTPAAARGPASTRARRSPLATASSSTLRPEQGAACPLQLLLLTGGWRPYPRGGPSLPAGAPLAGTGGGGGGRQLGCHSADPCSTGHLPRTPPPITELPTCTQPMPYVCAPGMFGSWPAAASVTSW